MATVHTVQTITASVAEWDELLARYTGVPAVAGRTITTDATTRTVTIDVVGTDTLTPGG
jgi:hypothetical protein